MITLWIAWKLEQKDKEKQENKKVGDSKKGGNSRNAKGGADAEMVGA